MGWFITSLRCGATLKHGIFTRKGGVSAAPFASLNLGGNVGDDPQAVRCNHERMYAALGVDDARACSVWQVHSADVVIANAPGPRAALAGKSRRHDDRPRRHPALDALCRLHADPVTTIRCAA